MSNPDDTQPPAHGGATPQHGAWPRPSATPPPPQPQLQASPPLAAGNERESRRRSLSALAAACFLAFAVVVGYSIGANHNTSTNTSSAFPSQQYDPGSGIGSNGNSNSSSSNGQQANIDVQSIAEKVSPSVVNLVSTINSGSGEGAGTGIVISPSGLALTNNHVIASSTDLHAEVGGNGDYHAVEVLGYDIEHDVALVQIEDVSDLPAASLGNSSSVQIGDAIVALGNAGGKGGEPTVVSGTVTDTGQSITASDQDGSNAERLSNLIQVDANIQPGDSGGPLVDANGDVVGMNAAASSGNGGFGFGGQSANEGYAIPIEDALAIGKKIASGDGSDTIHVGAHSAIMGIAVSDDRTGNSYGDPYGGNGDFGGPADPGGNSGSGAYVDSVQSGSGAAQVGIEEGSMITAVDGTTITSADQLRKTMVPYQPGDKVEVEWIDASGEHQSATLELGSGPPT